ncbi:MAG: nucleoside hydrolase [Tannerella sp.]|jgi:inosine-uridine nucleoside N-ribohydrolase|nr:nucleoside hydrolase [Tannerella sp.]
MMRNIFIAIIFLPAWMAVSGQEFPAIDEAVRIDRLKPKEGRVRMVLDTDTYNEIDDQFALAYALLSEDRVSVEAVYAAPFYNSRSSGPGDGMEKSYEEILRLLKMLKKPAEGFVFRGSTDYLKDALKPPDSEAVQDLIRRARASSPQDPLYVVAIGCITNVASAILTAPEIIKNIVVVWLGGNSPDWPTQREFNLVQDVRAGQVVLNSGVPLVIMPCMQVVSHFHTTLPELKYYLEGRNELCSFLYERVAGYNEKKTEAWSKEIWDVVVVAWLINPAWVHTDLVHSPVLTDQVTYSFDRSRHFIRMARFLSRDAIFRDLFSKLSKAG